MRAVEKCMEINQLLLVNVKSRVFFHPKEVF